MKKKGIIIVAGSDTQWTGGKQWLNVLLSRFRHRQWFSHIWIAGTYQYEYAKKLGFKNKNIIFYHYTADVYLFQNVSIENKKEHYPKTFLYIGRFHPVKGLKILQKAWSNIADKKGWTLTLVGSGKIDFYDSTITVKKFMEPEELTQEMQNAGCFILPSVKESWAVVLHEAGSAGLPIISTEICGAAPYFVINNYNGYLVKEKSVEELKNAMENIINLSDEQLNYFRLKAKG
jgi:glycosyltransferase involved in cell wall biosynthesis